MRRLLALLCLLFFAAAPVAASREPSVGAVPDWVERVEIPAANPQLRERPIQALLLSVQSNYGADLHEGYVEGATLVQSSQGLQIVGNIVIPWQPENSELIVHRVRILRGGAEIDLLAQGHEFTVLRRENNLESAMLDGVLTAVMQPEGLAVGDILNIAYSIRRRPSALPLRADTFVTLAPGTPVGRILFRDVWPEGTPIRWRTAEEMGRSRPRASRHGNELVLSLENAEGPRPLPDAAPRFLLAASHQISGYRDWADVAAMLAPHYDQAIELAADSPLRREIERIAAASTDPAARAMAALRLVQEDIRYLALSMGDAGYVPATADQTWTRRFGDCKGKTAVLLALLRGLGIDAEPVLVNTHFGDALGDRLPSLVLFNHVLVRARIAGRSYWLDGTRIGDRDLAELAFAPHGGGLRVRRAGATLEAIPWSPPVRPNVETNITYDASGGFDEAVPTRTETTYRGDLGTEWRLAAAQAGVAEIGRSYLEGFRDRPEDERVTEARFRENADGSVAFSTVSRTRFGWERAPTSSSYRTPVGELPAQHPESWRHVPQDREVPLTLPTLHQVTTETIVLPDRESGYSIGSADYEQEIAGARLGREVRIADGRVVARSWFRSTVREVAPAEVRSKAERLAGLEAEHGWLRAPPAFRPGAFTAATVTLTAEQAQAREHLERGYEMMQLGRHVSAIEEFDCAIELTPDWSLPHANRGVSLVHRNRLDEAQRSLETAGRLDDRDFVVHQGLGFPPSRRGRPEEAIDAFTRSLELDPANSFSLGMRAEAYAQLGRFEEALRDIDAAAVVQPDDRVVHVARGRLLAQLGRSGEAALALARSAELAPGDAFAAAARAEVLARLGRSAEASAARAEALRTLERMSAEAPDEPDLAQRRMIILAQDGRAREAIAIGDAWLRRQSDNVTVLAARCHVRAMANIELPAALRDCNQAPEYGSGDEGAMLARGLAHLRLERWAEPAADFGQVVAWNPRDAPALYGRGITRLRQGDRENGERDLAAARRYAFDIAHDFEAIGIRP